MLKYAFKEGLINGTGKTSYPFKGNWNLTPTFTCPKSTQSGNRHHMYNETLEPKPWANTSWHWFRQGFYGWYYQMWNTKAKITNDTNLNQKFCLSNEAINKKITYRRG